LGSRSSCADQRFLGRCGSLMPGSWVVVRVIKAKSGGYPKVNGPTEFFRGTRRSRALILKMKLLTRMRPLVALVGARTVGRYSYSFSNSAARERAPKSLSAAPDSRKGDKIHAGEAPADQKSRRARKKSRGDRRVDWRDGWFATSHLLKVGDQSAATYF
jgi:hypothetical protein